MLYEVITFLSRKTESEPSKLRTDLSDKIDVAAPKKPYSFD